MPLTSTILELRHPCILVHAELSRPWLRAINYFFLLQAQCSVTSESSAGDDTNSLAYIHALREDLLTFTGCDPWNIF